MTSWAELRSALGEWLFAAGPSGFWHIVVTAGVIYVVALVVVRVGKKRFIGRNAVLDAILGFMLGSTLSRTINGGAPVAASVAAAFVLVGFHWLFGAISARSDRFSRAVSGRPHVLVKDGRLDDKELRRHNLSAADLESALHESGIPGTLEDVAVARFERSGAISVVPKRDTRVVDVKVENGVQTVRVLLEGRD